MKKNSRKTMAFLIVHFTFFLIIVFTFIFAKSFIEKIIETIIPAIIFNTAIYGGLRVLNGFQKSANYQWQLDENMIDENTKKGDYHETETS